MVIISFRTLTLKNLRNILYTPSYSSPFAPSTYTKNGSYSAILTNRKDMH